MNEKKDALYLECYSGISGDMVTAALLDLGADEVVLRKALASLPLDGFSINISRVKKAGLDACDFNVVLDAEHENHDHDMAYRTAGWRSAATPTMCMSTTMTSTTTIMTRMDMRTAMGIAATTTRLNIATTMNMSTNTLTATITTYTAGWPRC